MQTTDGQSLVAGARIKHEVDRYHMMTTARLRQDSCRREQRSDRLYKADGAGRSRDHCDASASVGNSQPLDDNDEQPISVLMRASVVAKKSVDTRLRTWLISHVRGSTYLPQIEGLYHGGRTLLNTPQRSMTQMKPLHPSLYFQGCAYRRRAWELQKQLANEQPRRI